MLKDLLRELGGFVHELFTKEETWIILLIAGFAGIVLFAPDLSAALMEFLRRTWWFWLFVILSKAFESLWLFWRRMIFQTVKTPWIIMEIRIPRLIEKSPRSMESVLMAIHALRNSAGDIQEKYWDGEVTRWQSLEMVSFGGEVHFYIRFFKKQRNLVEAAFFAHYPELELVEVEDYVDHLPKTIKQVYEEGKNLYGGELVLEREAMYPFKTYPQFMELPEEEHRVDPMAAFTEVLSKLQAGEFTAIQILASAAADTWKDKWKLPLQKLKEETTKRRLLLTDETSTSLLARTPGELELLRDVEENLSKPAFDTLIRYIYISPQELYYDSYPRRGLRGAFNQYSALGRNSFVENKPMSTRAKVWHKPYIFPKIRVQFRKQRLMYNFYNRELPQDTFMGKLITSFAFNWNFASKASHVTTQGIATLFHPPTPAVLTAPHMPRVDSKRAGAPAGLAIFGGEGEIEQYQ